MSSQHQRDINYIPCPGLTSISSYCRRIVVIISHSHVTKAEFTLQMKEKDTPPTQLSLIAKTYQVKNKLLINKININDSNNHYKINLTNTKDKKTGWRTKYSMLQTRCRFTSNEVRDIICTVCIISSHLYLHHLPLLDPWLGVKFLYVYSFLTDQHLIPVLCHGNQILLTRTLRWSGVNIQLTCKKREKAHKYSTQQPCSERLALLPSMLKVSMWQQSTETF